MYSVYSGAKRQYFHGSAISNYFSSNLFLKRFRVLTQKKKTKEFYCPVRPLYAKSPTITGYFGFVIEKNSGREITQLSWRHRLRKAPFSRCFPSSRTRHAGVFKFLWFEERFWKARFSWRIGVNGRPNRRKIAVFSNFSGVLRSMDGTEPLFEGWNLELQLLVDLYVFLHPSNLIR